MISRPPLPCPPSQHGTQGCWGLVGAGHWAAASPQPWAHAHRPPAPPAKLQLGQGPAARLDARTQCSSLSGFGCGTVSVISFPTIPW